MDATIRFSEFLKANKILQKEISELFGITPQGVSGILKGKSDLTASQLILIANKYKNINMRWLLTGVGEMYSVYSEGKQNLDVVEEYVSNCKLCAEKDKRIFDLELHRDDLRKQLNMLEFEMGKKEKQA